MLILFHSQKGNGITLLEFRLSYNDVTILHNSHYITETPPAQFIQHGYVSILFLFWFVYWFLCLIYHLLVFSFIIVIIYTLRVFHNSFRWWFFHWSLSDSKFPQISRTLLSILAVLNSSSNFQVPQSFNNPLVTVPKVPIPIGIIVTFMFFNYLAMSRYLSFFSHSFSFILWSAGTAKSTILQVLFFFVDYYKVWSSGRD